MNLCLHEQMCIHIPVHLHMCEIQRCAHLQSTYVCLIQLYSYPRKKKRLCIYQKKRCVSRILMYLFRDTFLCQTDPSSLSPYAYLFAQILCTYYLWRHGGMKKICMLCMHISGTP